MIWESGTPYYAMKLIDGRSLHEVLCEKTSLQERLTLLPHLIDACEAVAYAHENQIIHRDLKPQNILVGSFGETVVIDWGIAKDLQETQPLPDVSAGPYRMSGKESELTEEGDILGTPAYMPLEQALGQEVDKRADVYALGAILYHLLSGESPYQGKENHEVLEVLTKKAPLPVEQKVASVPKDLLSIVNKAMAREPENRYSSANSLAEELKKFQAGQLVSSHTYSQKELLFRFTKRHLGMLILACIGVTILLVGGYTYYQNLQAAYLQESSARMKADTSFALLLKEQGRQELLAGNIAQAAVLLSEAYQRMAKQGEEDRNLQLLLGNALKPFENWRELGDKQNSVLKAEFSEDGKEVITYDKHGIIKTWNPKNGELLSTIECARSEEEIEKLSHEGEKLITLNRNKINVWNVNNCDLLLSVAQGTKSYFSFYLSPDKTKLITMYSASTTDWATHPTFEVWDINTGKLINTIMTRGIPNEEHPLHRFLSISLDREKIIGTDLDGNLLVLNVEDGSLLSSISKKPDTSFISAQFTPDGKRIIVFISNAKTKDSAIPFSIEIWGANSYQTLTSNALDHVKSYSLASSYSISYTPVEFSPDGSKFLLGVTSISNKRSTRIFSAITGQQLGAFELNWEEKVRFSSDGNQVLGFGFDMMIRVWDVNTSEMLYTLKIPILSQKFNLSNFFQEINFSLDYSSSENQILFINGGNVMICDIKSNPSYISFETESEWSLWRGESFDGSKVVTVNPENNAIVWDSKTGKRLLSLEGHDHLIVSIEFSPNDQKILTASIDHTVKLWNANTGKLLHSFQENAPLLNAQFSPDGSKILTLTSDNWFHLRETNTGKLLQSFEKSVAYIPANSEQCALPRGQFCSVFSFSLISRVPSSILRDSRNTVEQNNAIISWAIDVTSGAEEHSHFSPDGKYLAIPSGKVMQVWDPTTGRLLNEFSYDSKEVSTSYSNSYAKNLRSVQFSLDGTKLLINRFSRSAMYNVQTGQMLGNEYLNTGYIFAKFSRDSKKLMINAGKTISHWNTNTGELLRSVNYGELKNKIVFAPVAEQEHVIYSSNGTQFLTFKLQIQNQFFKADPPKITDKGTVLNLWDSQSGKKLKTFKLSSPIVDAKFSRDGSKLFLMYEEKQMQLWDLSIETRNPEEISKIVKEGIPWELDKENGYLVHRSLEQNSL